MQFGMIKLNGFLRCIVVGSIKEEIMEGYLENELISVVK
jgi:hypothetical protein